MVNHFSCVNSALKKFIKLWLNLQKYSIKPQNYDSFVIESKLSLIPADPNLISYIYNKIKLSKVDFLCKFNHCMIRKSKTELFIAPIKATITHPTQNRYGIKTLANFRHVLIIIDHKPCSCLLSVLVSL